MLDKGEKLPIEIRGATIYYVGPCPAKPGMAIGSAGPTTSGRMDAYAPRLMDIGLKGMIGKGSRKSAVIESMKKNTAVYFASVGGAGAQLAESIKEAEVVAFPSWAPRPFTSSAWRISRHRHQRLLRQRLYDEGRAKYEKK
jgi:fumarate hydratase subunit beta